MSHVIWHTLYEPQHDKTNKVIVRPAKTQISLGIHPVWSESSLSAWRKLGALATHWAHSEDSDQTGRMPADLSLRWAHTHFVCFVMLWFIYWVNRDIYVHTHHLLIMLELFKPSVGGWENLGQVMRKCVLYRMRTTKVQISLRICAVWSAPLLFAA